MVYFLCVCVSMILIIFCITVTLVELYSVLSVNIFADLRLTRTEANISSVREISQVLVCHLYTRNKVQKCDASENSPVDKPDDICLMCQHGQRFKVMKAHLR